MTRILVVAAGLFIFGVFAKRFGVKNTFKWACILTLSIVPFTLSGVLWAAMLPNFSRTTLAEIVAVTAIGCTLAVRQLGWSKVLMGLFKAALVASMITIMGALYLGMFSLAAKGGR
jgi:hypothetical protein